MGLGQNWISSENIPKCSNFLMNFDDICRFFLCYSFLAEKQRIKQINYSFLSLSASLDTQDTLQGGIILEWKKFRQEIPVWTVLIYILWIYFEWALSCLSIEGYLTATTWVLVLCFLNMKPQKLLLWKMSPWAFLELWLWWVLWVFFCMPNYTWDVDIKVFVILNLVLQLKSKDAQRKLFLKLFKSGHN